METIKYILIILIVRDTSGFFAVNSSVIGPSIKNISSTYSAFEERLTTFWGMFSDFLVLDLNLFCN
jgi:hypothetical protein